MIRRDDRAEALLVEADPTLGGLFLARMALRRRVGVGHFRRDEPRQCLVGQRALVLEVAPGDQVALGVRAEPALPAPQELLDLIVAHVVVLLVVEHRDQDVEVRQQVAQPGRPGKGHRPIRALAPVGEARIERASLGGHAIAERREEALQNLVATPAGERGDGRFKRQGLIHERRAILAVPGQRAAEDLGERHAEERGGDVRAIVDVLVRRRAAPAHQPDRIDLQQERRRAARVGRLGIEDMRLTEGQAKALEAGRVLVQQVAEIGRGLVRGRNRQQHRRASFMPMRDS